MAMSRASRIIAHQRLDELARLLGYDLGDVKRLSIEAGRVTVRRVLRDDQGRARLLPPDPDGGRRVDTTIDFIDIRL